MINKTLLLLRTACLWLAVLSIFAMFAIVAFNILARAVFDATGGQVNAMIFGAIELAQYALMIAVFAAIPAVARDGMIRVDILSQRFPSAVSAVFDRVWLILIAAFALVLAERFLGETYTTFTRGDETQDLRIPLWIFYAIATVECTVLAVLTVGEVLGFSHETTEDAA